MYGKIEDTKDAYASLKIATGFVILGLIVITLFSGIGPIYSVWSERLKGQAELARAEYNRQITIQEAKAIYESSKSLAEAEIVRAHGVSQANKIIGDSLRGNESYLRYLWIQGIEKNVNSVVYVPTEANLPILESHRWALEKNK